MSSSHSKKMVFKLFFIFCSPLPMRAVFSIPLLSSESSSSAAADVSLCVRISLRNVSHDMSKTSGEFLRISSSVSSRPMPLSMSEEPSIVTSHPLYKELIKNNNEYADILNAKLDGNKKEPGKIIAQQRGLILNLKQVAQELLLRRDELIEKVCLNEINSQRREADLKAEIARIAGESCQNDSKVAQLDGALAKGLQLSLELEEARAELTNQKTDLEAESDRKLAELSVKIAQLQKDVEREHANSLAETTRAVSLEVSLDEQVPLSSAFQHSSPETLAQSPVTVLPDQPSKAYHCACLAPPSDECSCHS